MKSTTRNHRRHIHTYTHAYLSRRFVGQRLQHARDGSDRLEESEFGVEEGALRVAHLRAQTRAHGHRDIGQRVFGRHCAILLGVLDGLGLAQPNHACVCVCVSECVCVNE